ncbi:unnamed protein product [Owenia fusiformis]|uniref:Uncharacterized protein n=1 Tax=Owenia fusiformis TaxID=6347 RepID=A0A8S4PM85_OWEFU|nr:unnamed protein product [Owenia fusiformis]
MVVQVQIKHHWLDVVNMVSSPFNVQLCHGCFNLLVAFLCHPVFLHAFMDPVCHHFILQTAASPLFYSHIDYIDYLTAPNSETCFHATNPFPCVIMEWEVSDTGYI